MAHCTHPVEAPGPLRRRRRKTPSRPKRPVTYWPGHRPQHVIVVGKDRLRKVHGSAQILGGYAELLVDADPRPLDQIPEAREIEEVVFRWSTPGNLRPRPGQPWLRVEAGDTTMRSMLAREWDVHANDNTRDPRWWRKRLGACAGRITFYPHPFKANGKGVLSPASKLDGRVIARWDADEDLSHHEAVRVELAHVAPPKVVLSMGGIATLANATGRTKAVEGDTLHVLQVPDPSWERCVWTWLSRQLELRGMTVVTLLRRHLSPTALATLRRGLGAEP